MHLLQHSRTTYQSIFQADERDSDVLLRFLVFLREDRAIEKICNHPQFSASAFWQKLAGDLFVGFSSNKVLLCSGHRYPTSLEVPMGLSPRQLLKKVLRKKDDHRQAFTKCYPEMDWSLVCAPLLDVSEYPYLRVLEAHQISAGSIGQRYLEVGAGNAVSVAHAAHVSPGTTFTVIDLPEMICAAYLLLRMIHPRLSIALPHEQKNADVRFLLPYQADRVPDHSFGMAFNMSSFQEMEPRVVNNYLGLFQRVLKPGGRMVLVNQESSRYIEGNCINAYDLSGFDNLRIQDAPFHNRTSAHAIGLNVKHVSADRT